MCVRFLQLNIIRCRVVHNVRRILYGVYCTAYIVRGYIVRRTLYGVYCTAYIVRRMHTSCHHPRYISRWMLGRVGLSHYDTLVTRDRPRDIPRDMPRDTPRDASPRVSNVQRLHVETCRYTNTCPQITSHRLRHTDYVTRYVTR